MTGVRRTQQQGLGLCRGAVLLTAMLLARSLSAAAASPEISLGVLPYMAALSDADFAPDTRLWHAALQQQMADPPPRAGSPGFDLESTALEVGVLHSLAFFADPQQPGSIWRRLAVDGHATVGVVYGRSRGGGRLVDGLFGDLRGDFGLQLLSGPAGRLRQLCGVFGAGLDYTIVTVSGRGPNADVLTSFTYGEVGLQAAFALTDAWQLQPFVMTRGGVTGITVHQATTLRDRYTGFYRIWGGAELACRWDSAEPGNQWAVQGAVAYADSVRFAITLAVVFRHGF
ncbi:MAG TPA: hypothetical protein VL860_05870 [Planctomycetota bacterium]|nr:hypothetical protein [Planctomycetota bacterium]